MTSSTKLLIAGGGTGGHIFPGIAIAEEWQRRGGKVVFLGTPKGQEIRLIPQAGFALRLLEVGTLKGGGIARKIKTIMGLPRALWQAFKILRTEKPAVVLGIGGFASGPGCLVAWLMGIPTAITDQNAHPGFTNRVLGRFVKRVFISFTPAGAFFPQKKVVLTGNPVRASFVSTTYESPRDKINLLIFGGSQGALAINQAFTDALDKLQDFWPRLHIEHNSGKTDEQRLKNYYQDKPLDAEVSPFFNDMHARLPRAHLVIARSGAGTLTELALCGKPAILIPYPFAADDHQKKNADVFVSAGAAQLFLQSEVSGEKLAALIREFIRDPAQLKSMAVKCLALAKPHAARDIVDGLLSLSHPDQK